MRRLPQEERNSAQAVLPWSYRCLLDCDQVIRKESTATEGGPGGKMFCLHGAVDALAEEARAEKMAIEAALEQAHLDERMANQQLAMSVMEEMLTFPGHVHADKEVRDAFNECVKREKAEKAPEPTAEGLDADMALMVANAHTYNSAESQVYHDAITLQATYNDTRAKLFGAAGGS